MPSLLHEGLIALVREQPGLAANLLTQLFNVELPDFAEAKLSEATLNDLVPTEYSADAVVVFTQPTANPRPVFGVVVEAQLRPDDRKRFTWPVYVTTARSRHRCPFLLLVVSPDPATATWSAAPIEIGGGMIQRPYVVGPAGIPKITDRERASREPQLAMLSLLAHGGGDDVDAAVAITLGLVPAIEQFPEDQRRLYSRLIAAALSHAARKELEMSPQTVWLFNESQRTLFAEGKAEGKAEGVAIGLVKGEAGAVLKILAGRGIALSDLQRAQIRECTDRDVLDRWIDHALVVSSVEELFA